MSVFRLFNPLCNVSIMRRHEMTVPAVLSPLKGEPVCITIGFPHTGSARQRCVISLSPIVGKNINVSKHWRCKCWRTEWSSAGDRWKGFHKKKTGGQREVRTLEIGEASSAGEQLSHQFPSTVFYNVNVCSFIDNIPFVKFLEDNRILII